MKTPAKPKDTEEPASEQVEEPAPKTKKGKTPVKAKAKAVEEEEEAPKEPEKTPVSKPKKAKTPAKAKAVEEEAPQEVVEKTPASKSKKEKTPSKPAAVEHTPSKTPEQPTPKTKKEKTPAKASQTLKATPKEPVKETPVTKRTNLKTPNKTPKSAKKAEPEPEPVLETETKAADQPEEDPAAPQDEESISAEEEVDEQIQALVQTVDAGDDDEPELGVVLFEQGQDVGKIPEVSKKEKKRAKKALAASKEKEETGVIYIGRLPHGFYEHEMKSYFSQFGPIRNLRVSRNRKTGKAKHFAFVEFEDASTAEIVAKTMDVRNRHSSVHSRLPLTASRIICFLATSSNAVSFQRPRSMTTCSRARTRDSRYVELVYTSCSFDTDCL